jgi:hypothetical protein
MRTNLSPRMTTADQTIHFVGCGHACAHRHTNQRMEMQPHSAMIGCCRQSASP